MKKKRVLIVAALVVIAAIIYMFIGKELAPMGEVPETAQMKESEPSSASDIEHSDSYTESVRRLESEGIPVPDKTVDFESLWEEENEDIYAWIYIPDTVIDYPVLQHPTENDYYLTHNLDDSEGYPGCIYSQLYNTKTMEDRVTTLYGHRMNNGTMFAGLLEYGEEAYIEEHPYIYIYTPDALYAYEIIFVGAFDDRNIMASYESFETREDLSLYIRDFEEICGDTYIEMEYEPMTEDDKLLALSTCVTYDDYKRFIVNAKRR